FFFVSRFLRRVLFVVAAAMRFATLALRPLFSSLALMCSYWRVRFLLFTPRGGISTPPGIPPCNPRATMVGYDGPLPVGRPGSGDARISRSRMGPARARGRRALRAHHARGGPGRALVVDHLPEAAGVPGRLRRLPARARRALQGPRWAAASR